jgi:hypothetical protein
MTLLEVLGLLEPHARVEIEVTAMLPDQLTTDKHR